MSASPAGNRMTADQPRLSQADALRLAREHFGLDGRLAPLASERDQNFRLTTDSDTYVLKIANAAEPPEVTNFQTEALSHIARTDPGLPVPRVIAARDGRVEIPLASGSIVRVLTWVDGTPLHAVRATPTLRRAVGRTAARLTRALEGFSHPAEDHELIWDIRNAAKLRPLLPSVTDAGLRALCETALDRFDAEIAPTLAVLPWQVVHADFNPHNLLTDPAATEITGILDFGDMVRTPRICDLAVAASYQADPADPLAALTEVIAGWHSILPLLPGEEALILDLVTMRMVTTVVLSNWRAARQPENAAYFLRNLPGARAGFEALAGLDRDAARARLSATLAKDLS
ncbi:phosphotransferase [Defluviimonas sp. SAOS-178_SWC]|uniref:phosphotransferase n=1 Tax=Defluviimonas sp. SAOS-178_SWC TaxID=3121287 RepID=UPI003221B8DA